MGLPQPLIDPLRELEEAEISRPVETLHEATLASFQEKLSALADMVREFEKGAVRIREASQAVHGSAEKEVSASGQAPNFDEHIESILKIEDDLRHRWLPNAETARKVKAGTFRLPRISSAAKARLVNLLERYIKTIMGILETLQQLRWTLMALRAEVEDPGDAPVFDNSQDLLGYLKTPST